MKLGVADLDEIRTAADAEIAEADTADEFALEVAMARSLREVLSLSGFNEESRPANSDLARGLAALRRRIEAGDVDVETAVQHFYGLGVTHCDPRHAVWQAAMRWEHELADAVNGVFGTKEDVRRGFVVDLVRLERELTRGS